MVWDAVLCWVRGEGVGHVLLPRAWVYPGGMNVVRLRAAFIPRRGNLGVSVAREPCPQEPSKGAQGRRLCPEEQGWQPPGLRRASWNRASFFPSAGGVTKQRHAWGLGRGADLWPSTLTPVLPPPPPPHRLPASFLRNPDGSKVCRAADSPGLGPLGALAWQTGRVG